MKFVLSRTSAGDVGDIKVDDKKYKIIKVFLHQDIPFSLRPLCHSEGVSPKNLFVNMSFLKWCNN